jgi:DUF4097 and DUF4098 domain-containing protein YvlB
MSTLKSYDHSNRRKAMSDTMTTRSPIAVHFAICLCAAWLILLPAAFMNPAAAQQTVDQTRPLTADGKVIVENIAGSVTLVGWDRNEVHVTGTLGDDVERVEIDAAPNRVSISVKIREGRHVEDADAELRIQVPAACRAEASTISADITSEGLTGSLGLESVSGDISAAGRMKDLSAESVSGTVTLPVSADEIKLSLVSGDVEMDTTTPRLSIETVSGDITLVARQLAHLTCSSVSGEIDFTGTLLPEGEYSFEAHSGDVTITLPGDTDADFDVSTFSGDIENGLSGERPAHEELDLGKQLEFTLGKGSARVSIDTFSSDVTLVRQ